MRSLLMLYASDFEDNANCRPLPGKSRMSEHRAFALLASVCSYWSHTLTGWPGSPTPKWVRHRLKKLIEGEFFGFR